METSSLSNHVDAVTAAPVNPVRQLGAVRDGAYDTVDTDPRGLRDYLRVLWKYRWLSVACFGLVFGGTLAITMLSPREYSATVKIRVTRRGPIELQLAENVLRNEQSDRMLRNGTSVFTATQVAILKSRDLAERVIRTHRLTEKRGFLHPSETGRAGLMEAAGELFGFFRPRGWQAFPTQPTARPGGTAAIRVPVGLINRYMSYLAVSDVRGTDLIAVRFTTPSPPLAAFLAGAHVQAYTEAADEARLAADVTAREFLQRHVREAQAKLEAAEQALNRFATQHPSVTLNREEKIIAQRMAELSSLLTKAEAERVSLETQHDFLTQADQAPQHYLLEQPVIQTLRMALLKVGAEQATLNVRLGSDHPRMRDLAKQKTDLERQFATELQKEILSVEARLDAARLNERSLRAKLARQEQAIVELRNVESTYDLLVGEVDSSRALFESLVKQQKETLVNSELATQNVRVVERAELPTRSARPNVALNLLIGLLGGLIFAVGAALLCDHFDNSVKSSDEVETLLQLPALAIVPNFAVAAGNGLRRQLAADGEVAPGSQNGDAPVSSDVIAYHYPTSIASEAYRVMRTAILYSTPEMPPRVMLVTSSRVGEGKTVTTLNLAVVLGLAGARVLVIDADLRRPGCHWALAAENGPGLSSYLAGQVELEDLIRPVEGVGNVGFVSAGPIPPNPAELLDSERMRAALAWARERYDFVLLDSAPSLPVTDAVVIAREADGVLFVVKGQDTPLELARRARDRLLGAGARFLGVIVNNVDLRSADYYASSYYHYYGAPGSPGAGSEEARA